MKPPRHPALFLRSLSITLLGSITLSLSTSLSKAEDLEPVSEELAEASLEAVPAIDSIDYGPTPLLSISEGHAQMFSVPAPRGLVTTATGEPIAISRSAQRLKVRPLALGDSAENVLEALETLPEPISGLAALKSVSLEELSNHLTHRPWVPLAITGILSDEDLALLADVDLPDGFKLETVYTREYPHGNLFAHAMGYVGDELPDQHGAIGETEHLWPPLTGRAGLEKTLHDELKGIPGEVSHLYSESGEILNQELAESPTPGKTVVTTLNLEMQRLAMEMLEKSGRPGAFVAVDADTGDILALASYPSYDPNPFVPGISQAAFQELADHEDAPFFDRAVTGEYPPGSTFKPFVALAGMEYGSIHGLHTVYRGPPAMVIDGRQFKNWHKGYESAMDLRWAITRSSNTWFYQAGLDMGSNAMVDVASRFQFGIKPDIPLLAVGDGVVPSVKQAADPRSLANMAIGQGFLLVSPLQLSLAMGAIANGEYVPKPRLIRTLQDPRSNEVTHTFEPEVASQLYLDRRDIEYVREGLWGVVNSSGGTASVASMSLPQVYGKTGTSQWAVDGKERSLAWFAGWVDAKSPRIAFAAVSHGRPGETLSGGRNAGPIASGFLKAAYRSPEMYAVTKPSAPLTPKPRLIAASNNAPEPSEIAVLELDPTRRGLFGSRSRGPGIFERLFNRNATVSPSSKPRGRLGFRR
ncbi:MAG: penicillin-binding transpeptidase domain-containing protein [Verrucomicrobiota bacterium]